MANYYSTARSNYVKIKDMEGLKKALEPFSDIDIVPRHYDNSDPNTVAFIVQDSDSGGWPTDAYVDKEDGTDEEVEFDPIEQICPFMEKGEVLIMMEVGAEKLRYVVGYGSAYSSDGDEIHIDLTKTIMERASLHFNVPLDRITFPES